MGMHPSDEGLLRSNVTQDELPFMWRPIVLQLFVTIAYAGSCVSLFVGKMAIRHFNQGLLFVVGLVWGLLVAVLVWPFFERTLPDQVRGDYRDGRAQKCWTADALAGLPVLIYASRHFHSDGMFPASGYVVGMFTHFHRMYLWLKRLPMQNG